MPVLLANDNEADSGPHAASGMMRITDREFELIRHLVYDRFGINLTDQKRSLVVGRLQKVLQDSDYKSFQEYYNALVSDPNQGRMTELINRISTNYSFFYREKAHFEYFVSTALPTVVGHLKRVNSRDLRIWAAGCSTGEEPYTLVMLMLEYFGNEYGLWDAGILATDISERVLHAAQAGIYPVDRVRQLPAGLRQRYFVPVSREEVAAVDRVKREVTFRRLNLMNERFPFKKPFQMIFCRNVMIYFDKPTRDALVRRFYDNLLPGGYLFIGHSETLGREQDLFRYLMPATYLRL